MKSAKLHMETDALLSARIGYEGNFRLVHRGMAQIFKENTEFQVSGLFKSFFLNS